MEASSDELLPSILKEEVENAIRKIKPGKSPGIDHIYTEYLKAGGETLIKALTNLFNRILVTGTVPTGFKEAMIVVLFKKGSMLDCSNYRPISLLSHVYKLFVTVISLRVKQDLYNLLPSSQAAYQPGRGTIEQILCMEQIIEKSLEFNNPTFITFIDYTKAFDSIHLESLWILLSKTNINKRYITLLKETYDSSTATIRTDIGNTRKINILKGVKQGDVLSAILFCIVIAAIQQQVEEECNSGISMGGHLISNLSYADDIAVVSDSVDELQKYLDSLSYHSSKVGLKINVAKTKCMSITKEPHQLQLKIYGKEIEEVSEFVYLGHKLSRINDGSAAVQHRISLGWAAFQNNKVLLTSSRIPPKVKGKIYKTYILPVVLYGLDCVNWTSILCEKVEVFQNNMMRIMLDKNILDKIRIKELQKITGLDPLISVIKSRVLKLFGHVKRSEHGLSRVCLEGNTPGKRSKGRPRMRWRDNVHKWSGLTTMELNKATRDRTSWKKFSHVGAQSAMSGASDR